MDKYNKERANGPQEVTADSEDAKQRLDNYLLRVLKGVPKSHIYRLVRSGQVRVNKGRKKPDYKLIEGDVIRIPPVRMSVEDGALPLPPDAYTWLKEAIVYEDDAVLVINKPSGLAVHAGSGIPTGLIEGLRALDKKHENTELVHRLDRETSGCLLLAKKRSALRALQHQLRAGEMQKIYSLLVKGRWHAGTKRVDLALRKQMLQGGERMVKVDTAGKPAVTEFRLKQKFKDCSLMEAQLFTGRTHQIRVHSSYLKHPIVGDNKYGDKEYNQQMKQIGLKRMFLHAEKLVFHSPATALVTTAFCPLPPALADFILKLTRESP